MTKKSLPEPVKTFLQCVRAYLQPRRPPTLCHYTDQAGLLGILTTRSIWASDLLSLNDSAEYSYGFQLVLEEVERRIERGDAGAGQLYSEIAGYARPESPLGVAAFSTLRDDLSQWRAYGRGSGGYSLRFSGAKLREAGIKSGAGLVPVLYRVREQKSLVGRFCDEAMIEILARRGGAAASDASSLKIFASLFLVCAFIKAPAFRAEREWRIVSFGQTGSARARTRTRPGRSILTPFVEIQIDDGKDSNPKLPLLDITVGPNPHPELARRAVLIAMRLHHQECDVISSDIPFRDW